MINVNFMITKEISYFQFSFRFVKIKYCLAIIRSLNENLVLHDSPIMLKLCKLAPVYGGYYFSHISVLKRCKFGFDTFFSSSDWKCKPRALAQHFHFQRLFFNNLLIMFRIHWSINGQSVDWADGWCVFWGIDFLSRKGLVNESLTCSTHHILWNVINFFTYFFNFNTICSKK